jgi:Mg-chelatase subunit ChlD
METAMNGTDRPEPRSPRLPQSGVLTAGSFDDSREPAAFQNFLRLIGQKSDLVNLPVRFNTRPMVLHVQDGEGRPVGNAKVRVNRSIELTTRSDGRVLLVPAWDRLPAGEELTLSVTPPDDGAVVTERVPRGAEQVQITLTSTHARTPRNLDLAIVLDTTGSMGDEITFLQSEIKQIAASVKAKFPQVNQRFALVVYKDEGDEYVSRAFNFTSSLDDFQRNLVKQNAGGGGDTPEAVHKALEDCKQLSWRDADTARVMFVVTDAPPHREHMQRTLDAADVLRKKGVAIYPIACSGYDDSAEFILRACALMTGGQFLFLTNDSGVGNSHAEPHIPFYHVEKLERLMVRMIATELAGKKLEAESGDILRTVGRSQASRRPAGAWRGSMR